jgi:ubiquinone/menaquinone biosynthesis C-methylase UbiE
MGSQIVQGALWGKRPKDWAAIQEHTNSGCYEYVLNFLWTEQSPELLDVGCASGLFCEMATGFGFNVTGIDASAEMIEEAKHRIPSARFLTGEMEELPFAAESFDVVSGFNSFQYAANVKNALTEAGRVLKNEGRLIVMIWGNKEDCEAATYLKAIGSLLPPPPPGAPGPFALTENNALENLLAETGFKIIQHTDLDTVWDYENIETAMKGLLSAGPAARAIDHSGFEKAYETLLVAVQPYIKKNRHVVYHNKFRIIVAEKLVT